MSIKKDIKWFYRYGYEYRSGDAGNIGSRRCSGIR